MFQSTAYDVWLREYETPKVTTLFRGLDQCLGGGIRTQAITEFCGAPGSGKTQMCMQLSVAVQFAKEIGGLGGRSLYIDTNQDFNPHRLKDFIASLSERAQRLTQTVMGSEEKPPLELLDNVSYTYCSSYTELIAAVLNLRNIVKSDPTLKLIIVDSFSFALRNITQVGIRTHFVYLLLTELHKLANEFELAVVITNELTTRVMDESWKICPALGESHAHKINERILLSRNKDNPKYHVAVVEKSFSSPKVVLPFQIRKSGIRWIS